MKYSMPDTKDSLNNFLDSTHLVPSGGALGAEITGIDLSLPLSPAVRDGIQTALLEHCVLFFRGQRLSDENQVQFTSYFGKPVEHVRKQRARRVKEIFIISNLTQDGEPIGALGNDEIPFHSDLSYMPMPGTISVLYAVEIPKVGGATLWCNCQAAYEALDPSMKQRLQGLRAVHRHYVEVQNPPFLVDHPVVIKHPESGKRSLYVGPHLTKHIVGMSPGESVELLGELFAHQTKPEFVWAHQWQVGDLVMWDNRPTMHRREPFPATERRVMKRTQVFNDEVPVDG